MRLGVEVFLSDGRSLRLGAITGKTPGARLDRRRSGVSRVLIYRVDDPGGLADADHALPVILLDPLPAETDIEYDSTNGKQPPRHHRIKGQLRCWLALDDCLDFELAFSKSGELAKFEIGKPNSEHRRRLEASLRDPGTGYLIHEYPVPDLSGSGLPSFLGRLFDIDRHRNGSVPKAQLVLDWVTRLAADRPKPDPSARPFEPSFGLTLDADGLTFLKSRLRDHVAAQVPGVDATEWIDPVVLRQRPERWSAPTSGQRRDLRPRARDERWILGLEGAPHTLGAVLWNCWVGDRIQHLDTVRDGRPRSFLPLIDPDDVVLGRAGWHLVFGGRIGDADLQLDRFVGLRVSAPRAVELFLPNLRNQRGEVPRVGVKAYAEHAEADNPDRFALSGWRSWRHLQAIAEEPGLALFTDGRFWAEAPSSAEAADARRWRMGAIDIELSTQAFDEAPIRRFSGVRLGLRRALALDGLDCHPCRGVGLPDRLPIDSIDIQLVLPVVGVRPGGQDSDGEPFAAECDELDAFEAESGFDDRASIEALQRGVACLARRPRPLVIPDPWRLPSTPADAAGPEPPTMLLEVTERRDAVHGSSLELRLASNGAVGAGGRLDDADPCSSDAVERVLVLDPDPFFAAVVAHEPIGPRDASAGTDLATWSSRGTGAWHLHLPSREGFCLTLPPQGVGETMERYGTFGEDPDTARDAPADFRFSPPARLSMRTTYFEQNFPEVPWNLRRLLTRPGRELAGAELEAAHFELLYGLSCHLEPDDGMLRLAEVQTLVGGVPGMTDRFPRSSADRGWLEKRAPDGAETAYDRARLAWARFVRQLGARLAIFEVWDPARLATLRRREGVSCWIRSPQHFYPPTSTIGPPKALAGLKSAELAHPTEALGSFADGQPRTDPHPRDRCDDPEVLCGGVTWGFESRNVFEATVRPTQGEWPRSTAAELADLRLSALGAWGHQMAAFDAGRTKIYGDVAMGRTLAYRIERIGRIGVFWHRAKHVIVYERGVVPSRQFARDQDPLEGRPVLRKVREYVELEENERTYPDSGGGLPRALGFVRRVTFGQQADEVVRFHVKSAWGQDVDWQTADAAETGWKVPIWIDGAEPADVFPRPRVRVTVLSVIDGETREVERYFDNPENLFFFTRTTDPGADAEAAADTNRWPPAPDVDFVDLPRPAVAGDPAFTAGRLRQTTAGDRAIPPGHGVTTFRLEPSPHGVDLASHRQEQPMAARLSTFTMSRSIPGPEKPKGAPELPDPAQQVADAVQTILAGLPDEGELGAAQLQDVRRRLGNIASAADDAKGKVQKARQGVEQELDRWQDTDRLLADAKAESRHALDRELQRWLGRRGGSELEKALRPLVRTLIETSPRTSGELHKVLHRELDRLVLDIVQKVTLLTPSPLVLSGALLPPMRQAITGLDAVVTDGEALNAQLGSDAEALARRLDKEGATFERRARAWLDRIDRVLGGVDEAASAASRVAVGGAKVPIPGLGPQILGPALELLRRKARQVRGAVAALREIVLRGRSAVHLTDTEIRRRIAQLRTQIAEPLQAATDGLATIRAQIDSLKRHARTIERAIQEIEDAKLAKLQELDTELRRLGGEIIDEIVAASGNLEQRVGQWVDGWLADADSWIQDVADEVEGLATDLDKAFEDEFKPAVRQIEDTLDAVKRRATALQGALEGRADDLRRQLEAERDALVADLEETYSEELGALRRWQDTADAVAEPGLRLVRAFGEPPEVGGLQFDRPETAFVFEELDDRIGITPVIGRVAQAAQVAQAVGDVLEPLGIDLPVRELGEQLLPEELKNFDLSDILPDIAGLRLDKLFSGVKMPGTGENVRVRHGIDPQTRRGYFHAELETQIDDKATVFATGPLVLAIDKPTFWGRVDAQIDTSGNVRRTVDGRLFGDWQLTVGGTLILIIRKTRLEFDEDGELRFHIRPEQVVLPDTLQFVSDLLETITPDVEGLTLHIEPTGVTSILSLPLPDIQAGTSGITGLSLGASLALRWVDTDPQGRSGFSIALSFHLSHPERPFAVSIFILGGGGYLTVASKYFPVSGLVETEVRMAITASAGLAIALGPISGGVFVYFGITGSYSAGNGALDVGTLILIVGRVSVLGIATASVRLGLEVRYAGGALVGTGFVSITIKICWCFTLKVRKSVTYTLGGRGRSQGNRGHLPGPRPVARLASLGGADLPEIVPAVAFGQIGNADDGLETGIPVPGSAEVRDRVRRHLAMLA